jgi:polyphenol oxidase
MAKLPQSPSVQANLLPYNPPHGVRACMTERTGGVSAGAFKSLNLGDHVGDKPEHVLANREVLARNMGRPAVYLKQVHGVEAVEIKASGPQQQGDSPMVADACWSDQVGAVCTILVADCLPVLLATEDGKSVAAVHAGWRGLAGENGSGVLEQLFQCWPAAQDARQRSRMWVWLGPCIGPHAFEVGSEVRDAFVGQQPRAEPFFVPHPTVQGKYWADLAALARQRLHDLGVANLHGNDSSAPWCTYSNASRYFSHRRDARLLGSSGRMAACVWRV